MGSRTIDGGQLHSAGIKGVRCFALHRIARHDGTGLVTLNAGEDTEGSRQVVLLAGLINTPGASVRAKSRWCVVTPGASVRAKSRWCVVVLVASVFAGLGNCLTPAFAVQSINLLPLGDSITYDGYYIAPLVTQLTGTGYSPTVIANEGHPGYTISGLDAGIATYLNHPNVNAANTYILLMIGINDMAQTPPGPSAAALRLGQLISDIRTDAPLANVVVAQLTPANGYSASADAAVPQFNQDIVPVVQGFGPSVRLVDMYTPFMPDPSPYMNGPGNVHPNQAGGDLMAPVWYRGITGVPEPGALVLLGSGAVGLGAFAWRRRRRQSSVSGVFILGPCPRERAHFQRKGERHVCKCESC